MKKFLTAILSWCLFQVQIGSSLALVTPEISPESPVAVTKVPFKIGFNTALAATDKFQPQKIDTVDYLSLIAMMGFTAAAVLLVRSCKVGTNSEVWLFAGGAAAFIAGEVVANIQYKKINTNTIEYNAEGKLDDGQAEALRKLKQSYEDVKNTAETKRMLQIAATLAFVAAGVVATVKYFAEKAAYQACKFSYGIAAQAIAVCDVDEAPSDCGSCKKPAATTCSTELGKARKEEEQAQCIRDRNCNDKQETDTKNSGEESTSSDAPGNNVSSENSGSGISSENSSNSISSSVDSSSSNISSESFSGKSVQGSRSLDQRTEEILKQGWSNLPPSSFFRPSINKQNHQFCWENIFTKSKKLFDVLMPIANADVSRARSTGAEDANPQKATDSSASTTNGAQGLTSMITADIQKACASCLHKIAPQSEGCDEHHRKAFEYAVACQPVEVKAADLKTGATTARFNQNFFTEALNLMVPPAAAMDTQGFMLGMGALGIGILAGTIVHKQWAIDKLIPYPGHRIALFGGAALLAGATILTTSGIVSKAKKNAEKIDKILKRFEENAAAATAIAANPAKTPRRQVNSMFVTDFNIGNGQKFPCVVQGSKGGSCGSYTMALQESLEEDASEAEREGFSIDPSVARFANSLEKGIDQLQGNSKISGASLANLSAGAAQKAALAKASENIRMKLNKKLQENGEAPIDFAQQDQQVAEQIRQETLASLQQSGAKVGDVLKDTSLDVVGKLAGDEPPSDTSSWSMDNFSAVAGPYNALKGSVRDLPPLKMSMGEDPAAKLELDETSIIADQFGPSLWQLLRGRYLKHYDQFFERLPEAAPTKAPKKSKGKNSKR